MKDNRGLGHVEFQEPVCHQEEHPGYLHAVGYLGLRSEMNGWKRSQESLPMLGMVA